MFPSEPEVSTPPHQDFLNNQGSPQLTAAWIPLGDCPMKQGTLAVLRGSHRYGVLPLEFSLGPGNRQAVVPNELRDRLTWVTNDFSAGDVLLFGALTVHASLHNATGRMRLSVDFRYQCEGEPASDLVLEPHFDRLSWERDLRGLAVGRAQVLLARPRLPGRPVRPHPVRVERARRRRDQGGDRLRALAQAAPRGHGAGPGPPRLSKPGFAVRS